MTVAQSLACSPSIAADENISRVSGGYRWVISRGVPLRGKKAEFEAWRLAHQDPLTGLPNRFQFQARFEEALSNAQANGTSVSLLLLDLDDFKDVNDTLGHDAGDALLKEIADRLRRVTRDCDTVARVGGD